MENQNINGISDSKLKHILGVARECERLASEKGLSKDEQTACFVMGFLHDIGYERCDKSTTSDHPKHSYSMICDFEKHKYDILNAIKSHGNKYENMTVFDEILNTADLTIDYQGNPTTIEQRLFDIKNIHGEDSLHYQHACKQADAIIKKRKDKQL